MNWIACTKVSNKVTGSNVPVRVVEPYFLRYGALRGDHRAPSSIVVLHEPMFLQQ